MRREMAVLEAHMRSLEAQLDEGVPGSRWKDLTKASAALDAARAAGDRKAAAKAIKQMQQLVAAEGRTEEAWKQWKQAALTKTTLLKVELARMVNLRQFVTVEQLQALIAALQVAIGKCVTDRDVRRQMAEEFNLILERGGYLPRRSEEPPMPE